MARLGSIAFVLISTRKSVRVLGILVLQLGACARYQRYQSAPLAVSSEATVFAARRLDDPVLARTLAAHGVAAHDTAWDSRQLALAALYFRPDLTEAQRVIAAARAAEITAGVRPYPSVTATTGRASRVTEGRSTPWSFSPTFGFTLERGGKRDARIARARAATLAAQLRLESTAWQAVVDARVSTLTAFGADVELADGRAELAQLRIVLSLLRVRYNEGQIARTDLARAETDVQLAAVASTQALRARADARAALAHALGVPVREVDTLSLRPDTRSACVAADSLPTNSLEALGLRTRPEVGVALADYAVAESDLRVRIAQQYPDIVLAPGLAWDQGVRSWVLSLALPGIPIDRARGPIAEAVARRAVQAARVMVVQDSVLAAVDSSAAACRTADREITVADSLFRASDEQLVLARSAYQRGEIGKTEIAIAQLARMRAERPRHQAAQRRMAVGAALENATGVWLSGAPINWQDLIMPDDSLSHRIDRGHGHE